MIPVKLSSMPTPRFMRKRGGKSKLPPGTLVYTGERRVEKTRIALIDYDQEKVVSRTVENITEVFACRDSGSVSWINIDGLHDTDMMSELGKHFGIHPLVLEDIVNTQQRVKLEDHREYLFLVARMLYIEPGGNRVHSEQVSFILGPNYVISFQESPGDVFQTVRVRIDSGRGWIRRMGPDYLLYALLDAIVDGYFVVMDSFGEQLDALDTRVVADPKPDDMQQIHSYRRELVYLARHMWPLREVISGLQRPEAELVRQDTSVFLKDVHDHVSHVIEVVEIHREMVAGLQDLYHAASGNRMNEVVKVLTVISTLFVPLTFIAGVFGMNFHHMPELSWKWGYMMFWGISAAVAVTMLSFFRRRGWF